MAKAYGLAGHLRRLLRGIRRKRGFALVELLIVVVVIAVLVAVVIPNFVRARGQSQVAASKNNLKALASALEQYHGDNGRYPVGTGPAGYRERPGIVYACHSRGTTGMPHGKHSDCGTATSVLSVLVPTYIRVIPSDPCTGGQYFYTSADGSTYALEIDYPVGVLCDSLVGTEGDPVDLTYTPDGGLKEGP